MSKLLWKGTQGDVNKLAEYMHDRYEKHSKFNDWETQESCKEKPFDDLPEENQKVMKDLAGDMLIWRGEYIREIIEEIKKEMCKYVICEENDKCTICERIDKILERRNLKDRSKE